MRSAEEFPDRPSDLTQPRPPYRRRGAGAGARPWLGGIRYAHSGLPPRPEPLCTVAQGESVRRDPAHRAGGRAAADAGGSQGTGVIGCIGAAATPADEAWSARFPVARHRSDLWVLVCGGIAAAAAFAAAFVAAGGVPSHPAAPGSTVPAVVSQVCPAPVSAP
jgi:hypothetical protein